jgi:hypothetical protein
MEPNSISKRDRECRHPQGIRVSFASALRKSDEVLDISSDDLYYLDGFMDWSEADEESDDIDVVQTEKDIFESIEAAVPYGMGDEVFKETPLTMCQTVRFMCDSVSLIRRFVTSFNLSKEETNSL